MSKTLTLNSTKHWETFGRIKQLISCRSTDPDRQILHHILIESTGKNSKAIATDGRTLRVDRIHKPMVPGIYDVAIDKDMEIKLERCGDKDRYPRYKHEIPVLMKKDYHVLEGSGPDFILWASASLGTYLDPKLINILRMRP